MTKKNRLKLFKRILVSFIILAALLTHFFVPRLITEIRNPIVGLIKRNHNVSHEVVSNNNNSKVKRKVITLKSFDELKLLTRLTYANSDAPKGTIILLHRIRSNRNHFIELSAFLSKDGFNSVALDSRAHGESEGDFCSFGVNEKQDVSALINHYQIMKI
jgi:predicted alpha/beta-fold hydrolase